MSFICGNASLMMIKSKTSKILKKVKFFNFMVEQRSICVQSFISLLNLRSNKRVRFWIQFYQNLTVCYSIARLGRNNHIHIHSIYQETSLYGFLCKTRFKWPCDKNMENFLITKIKFLEKNSKEKQNKCFIYLPMFFFLW